MVSNPPGGVAPHTLSLIETPTWALATVFFIFISLSIFVEYLIHHLCSWIQRLRKTALLEAVEKLKTVLMILGFMSLVLAVTQKPISRVCIPTKHAYSMLPCRRLPPTRTSRSTVSSVKHLLINTSQKYMQKPRDTFVNYAWPDRSLTEASGSSSDDPCSSQGKTSFISEEGVNQLSIFVFVLAVMQIVYSFLTMALGRAKMRRWKAWEKETQTVEYLAANDPNRFRYTRQTTFGRRHMYSCTETTLELWTKCFFRQFFHSVAKVDYLTLRHGFISAHLSNNNSFDFQKYIERSLEDDFKVVVGIRPSMWILVVFFMLLDVHGWEVYLWVSFVPPLLVLVLGTKMEVIVAKMALQLKDQNSVIKGAPLVLPNDSFFWFGHPKHVLTLVHFTLFMNSFEVAFFIWVTLEFGIKSCYHEHIEIIIVRVVLPIIVQVLCSYITLPLYALVTQMGSQYKKAVLEEQMASVLKQWHADVRKKRKKNQEDSPHSGHNGSFILSTSPDGSSNYRTLAEMAKHSTQIDQTEIEDSVQEIQHIELDLAMTSSSTSTLDTQDHNVKDQT